MGVLSERSVPDISLVDYGFLLAETRASPRHVSVLHLFEPPPGAPDDFVARLLEGDRTLQPVAPFCWKLGASAVGLPRWEVDGDFDIDHHLVHTALPGPGSEEQLLEQIARIHEPLLDRNRPLWEIHLIEGLADGRFAAVMKLHHAYTDGVSFSRRLVASLAEHPEQLDVPPIWANDRGPAHREKASLSLGQRSVDAIRAVGRNALVLPQLTELIIKHGLRLLSGDGGDLPVPFSAPRTLYNKPLTYRRSVAICSLELARVRDLARQHSVSVNDVLLTLCDMAMRQYLDQRGEPLEQPLVAQMPMSLRRRGERQGPANQITIALLEMASNHTDPLNRLREVHQHARNVKYEYASLTPEATEAYSMLTQLAAQLGDVTGLSEKLHPLGNVVISNVAGHQHALYLRGARLLGSYPISTIAPNTAINITIYSHEGQLRFGLVAGRDAIPDLSAIAEGILTAMVELEQASGQQARPVSGPD
ncbi:MAG: wax ester/triacylglycerol synthase family O-acyltransferase [Xanthomonadales bacterium]|nr:wax ester/triacylglycerol synthase family O-acyltransferase [Xanthomonadales bacterium]